MSMFDVRRMIEDSIPAWVGLVFVGVGIAVFITAQIIDRKYHRK